jgi:hypothetical protein
MAYAHHQDQQFAALPFEFTLRKPPLRASGVGRQPGGQVGRTLEIEQGVG